VLDRRRLGCGQDRPRVK